MSKVIFVGDIYYADLSPGQGLPGPQPRPPGYWGGMNPHPDQGLPGEQPGVSPPIYHPGHPDHGLPSRPPGYWGGMNPHPDQGLPGGGSGSVGSPSHPIHIPGVPDQGLPPGQVIPPDQITDPDLPEEYDNDLVVAVKQPGGEEWTYRAYTLQPDQGQPVPTPQQPPQAERKR